MEIQLEDYENGKPLVLNASSDIIQQIKTLKEQKKYAQVVQLLQTLPCNKQKYLIKSNALLHLKKWDDLIKCCDKGLTISEESQFYNLKGKAMGKLGNNNAKVQLLKQAIQINKNIGAYHRNLGAAYYGLKNYQQALKQHQLAIKLQPKNAINYHNKGAALFRMGRYEDAKQYFTLAIDHDGKLSLSYSWLGDCQRETKNYQKAVELYQKAYELSNNVVYLRQKQKLQKQHNLKGQKPKKKFFGLFG